MKRWIMRPSVDREVDDELHFHIEMRVRELVEGGMGEGEARAEALRRAGNIDHLKTRMRHEARRRDAGMRRRMGWDEIVQDLRFGWRQIRRAPSFGIVAVLTLALAIGANTAVFSVVNGVLLRPLPYQQPDDVAMLWTRYLPASGFDIPKFPLSGPEILEYRETTRALERVGVYQSATSRTLTGDGGEAERLTVVLVSSEVMPLLGVQPILGRTFVTDEDVPDGPAVALLGHELWAGRFGADSTLVGRSILLDGVSTRVVGIMPEGFTFGSGAQLWLPVGLHRSNEGGRAAHAYFGVGRLAKGMTWADVDAELDVLRERWASEHEHNVAHFIWAEPALDAVLGDAPRTLVLFLVAAGLVLLVACVNVANLLLARGERRRGEIALRSALGAGRGRILRQLLAESVALAGWATLLGVGLAWLAIPALVSIAPTALPRLTGVSIDRTVLVFTVGAALVTVLLFGVAPALSIGRGVGATPGRSHAGRTRGGDGLRRALVCGEAALSLVVVLLAGLLVRSYAARLSEDRGLDASNLLTLSVSLMSDTSGQEAPVPARLQELVDRIADVPGVDAVAAASSLPFDGTFSRWDFQLDDRPPAREGERAWSAGAAWVTPGYFETLGVPMVTGRGIEPTDGGNAPWVGVVSETFAETFWPGESALGKMWGYAQSDSLTNWITVVGVARDPVLSDLGEDPYPFVWLPSAQAGQYGFSAPRTFRLAVRSGFDVDAVVPAVRAAVAGFDPNLPIYRVSTMEDAIRDSLSRSRLATSLLGLFAVITFLMAIVGIYGAVSYSVAGRKREIGVRMALGAEGRALLRMVVFEGMRPVLAGVGGGLVAAWLATRLVRSMLYGVAPTDALTFVLVPACLLAAGVLASWLPARRATAADPTEALREE